MPPTHGKDYRGGGNKVKRREGRDHGSTLALGDSEETGESHQLRFDVFRGGCQSKPTTLIEGGNRGIWVRVIFILLEDGFLHDGITTAPSRLFLIQFLGPPQSMYVVLVSLVWPAVPWANSNLQRGENGGRLIASGSIDVQTSKKYRYQMNIKMMSMQNGRMGGQLV